MKRHLSRSAFTAVVALFTVPFLTPCGSISIPLRIVRNVGATISGDDKSSHPSANRNSIAETPPLHVVRYAAVPGNLLISDVEVASGRRKRDLPTLKSAGTTAARWAMLAASVVDPMLAGGFGAEDNGLAVDSLGEPDIKRGQVLVMTLPRVELHGYEIVCWNDGKAPCGIAHARVHGSAKILVQERGGHEYFALANRIHYHAERHDLILEGDILVRCGTQTIRLVKPALARLGLATRSLYVAGTCEVSSSPTHDERHANDQLLPTSPL